MMYYSEILVKEYTSFFLVCKVVVLVVAVAIYYVLKGFILVTIHVLKC